MTHSRYCLDTSALMDGWIRWYPHETFPALWHRIDQAIASGTLCAPDEVLREIEKRDDSLHAWAKARTQLFVPIDDAIQLAVAQILGSYPTFVDNRRGRSQGDPWVVALAQVNSCTVVTAEKHATNGKAVKIPNVCDGLGVRHVSFLGMMREQRWVF